MPIAASAAAVAVVTLAIAVLEPTTSRCSASACSTSSPCCPSRCSGGSAFALPVAVACMLAFNYFFLPPTHTFTLRGGRELVRAGRLLGDRGRRQRARRERTPARGDGRAARARVGAARRRSPPSCCAGARSTRSSTTSRARAAEVLGVERARSSSGRPRLAAGAGAVPARGRRAGASGRSTTPRGAEPNLAVRQPLPAGARRAARRRRRARARSSARRSRPRRCAAATWSRPRCCGPSRTTCARR